jgi:hypothetical protein
MQRDAQSRLDGLVREAIAIGDIASAVAFTVGPAGALGLAAAAGIDGPPLDGLMAAVRDPAHPVARALTDSDATFDVRPMNPGGPALRSHLPLRAGERTLGVLALAHQTPLTGEDRDRAIGIAKRAVAILEGEDAAVRAAGRR